jgi:hypothetical protein
MKTRAMRQEMRKMLRHLPINFLVVCMFLIYLPPHSLAGKITPWKTQLGFYTSASGSKSTALGVATTASGLASMAMGWTTTASGSFSTSMGFYTTAYSAFETVIGRYTTQYTPASTTDWNSSDRLFVIGNGPSSISRSDAMVVLKNGNVGIGTAVPTAQLHVYKPDTVSEALLRVSSGTFPEETRLVVMGDGNVGIGTSIPIGKLHIEAGGGEGLRVISSNGNSHFPHSSGWSYISGKGIIFRNGDNERMRLDSSGNVGIGTTSPSYKLEVNGSAGKLNGGSWSNSSDARLKDISGEYDRGLDQIVSLKPVSFYYKEGNPRGLPTDEEYVGFVAQEVRDVFPEAVSEGKDGYLDFNMHPVNVAVVNAIKELKAENEALKAENSAFRKMQQIRFQKQQMEIEELRSMIKGLKS